MLTPSLLRTFVLLAGGSLLARMLRPPLDKNASRRCGDNPTTNEINRVAAAIESYTREYKAAEKQHAEYNSKVHWWTRFAAIGAGIATFAAILVFVANIRSIQESRRATNAAVRAAEASSRQADISADIGKRQLRAYITAAHDDMKVSVTDNVMLVSVAMKNMGLTPAYDAKGWMVLGIGPFHQGNAPFSEGKFENSGIVGPQSIMGLTTTGVVNESIIQSLKIERYRAFNLGAC
jgi:hypothetical protein